MKRDWDIIRAILLKLENAPTANTSLLPTGIPDYPEQAVAYNMRLLDQAGYVSGKFLESSTGDGQISAAIIRHMTHSASRIIRYSPK